MKVTEQDHGLVWLAVDNASDLGKRAEHLAVRTSTFESDETIGELYRLVDETKAAWANAYQGLKGLLDDLGIDTRRASTGPMPERDFHWRVIGIHGNVAAYPRPWRISVRPADLRPGPAVLERTFEIDDLTWFEEEEPTPEGAPPELRGRTFCTVRVSLSDHGFQLREALVRATSESVLEVSAAGVISLRFAKLHAVQGTADSVTILYATREEVTAPPARLSSFTPEEPNRLPGGWAVFPHVIGAYRTPDAQQRLEKAAATGKSHHLPLGGEQCRHGQHPQHCPACLMAEPRVGGASLGVTRELLGECRTLLERFASTNVLGDVPTAERAEVARELINKIDHHTGGPIHGE